MTMSSGIRAFKCMRNMWDTSLLDVTLGYAWLFV